MSGVSIQSLNNVAETSFRLDLGLWLELELLVLISGIACWVGVVATLTTSLAVLKKVGKEFSGGGGGGGAEQDSRSNGLQCHDATRATGAVN